jgi:hypothetical protein
MGFGSTWLVAVGVALAGDDAVGFVDALVFGFAGCRFVTFGSALTATGGTGGESTMPLPESVVEVDGETIEEIE